MNATVRLLAFSASLSLAALTGCQTIPSATQASTAEAVAGPLQVQINVPPSWRPMFEERVAEAFASRVEDVFRTRGYRGEFTEVDRLDDVKADVPLLTINLTEWRVDPTGNIVCTFSADARGPSGTRHLGLFTDSAFRWMSGPGRFGLADSFGQAAEGAIRQMYDKLLQSGALPTNAVH